MKQYDEVMQRYKKNHRKMVYAALCFFTGLIIYSFDNKLQSNIGSTAFSFLDTIWVSTLYLIDGAADQVASVGSAIDKNYLEITERLNKIERRLYHRSYD